MILVISICGLLIVVGTCLLILGWAIYGILLLIGQIKNRELVNDTFKKILYIVTTIPFIASGLYVVSILFVSNLATPEKIMMIILGLFLIIYPLIKLKNKIQDINYFGGV